MTRIMTAVVVLLPPIVLGLVATPAAEGAKRSLLMAVGALRREPTLAQRAAVLDAVAHLEACDEGKGQSSVDGRWSLIFSTQVAGESQRRPQGNALQPLIDFTYATFFKIAPALAGAQPDGSSSEARNEQLVDTARGLVRNRVRIALPFNQWLEILVDGEAALDGATEDPMSANDLSVTFSECSFRLESVEAGEGLRVPLPRPIGALRTTWCDEDLRASLNGTRTCPAHLVASSRRCCPEADPFEPRRLPRCLTRWPRRHLCVAPSKSAAREVMSAVPTEPSAKRSAERCAPSRADVLLYSQRWSVRNWLREIARLNSLAFCRRDFLFRFPRGIWKSLAD